MFYFVQLKQHFWILYYNWMCIHPLLSDHDTNVFFATLYADLKRLIL